MPPFQAIDWYQQLKSWQSGIAALIVLVGLILGALLNSRLNRRRDNVLRREETLAVLTALYGEINHIPVLTARSRGSATLRTRLGRASPFARRRTAFAWPIIGQTWDTIAPLRCRVIEGATMTGLGGWSWMPARCSPRLDAPPRTQVTVISNASGA